MPSLRLRVEPTVHQIDTILARVDAALAARGARTSRTSTGAVRFRLPVPWRTRRAGLLVVLTGGEVKVSAGWGEPRRIRWELRFTALYLLGALLTAGIVLAGWDGPRLALARAVLLLWAAIVILRIATAHAVRRLLARCGREIVEEEEQT